VARSRRQRRNPRTVYLSRLKYDLPDRQRPEGAEPNPVPSGWGEVETAWSMLSVKDRLILELHVVQGETFQAIGDRLGIRRQAVQKRSKAALEKLRTGVERNRG
jgi:DNA-directed RNA polymerase specialized sigma24 family protein